MVCTCKIHITAWTSKLKASSQLSYSTWYEGGSMLLRSDTHSSR